MLAHVGVEVQLLALTSAPNGNEWLLSRLVCFASGERTNVFVELRADVGALEERSISCAGKRTSVRRSFHLL